MPAEPHLAQHRLDLPGQVLDLRRVDPGVQPPYLHSPRILFDGRNRARRSRYRHRYCPDSCVQVEDVVLGFDTLDGYASHRTFFGAVVGRYGNRIAKGRFTLDGKTYQLATNNGPNHLHGGVNGFDRLLWKAQSFDRDGNTGVAYTLTSRAGDEGYPGTLDVRVTYTLTPANELMVEYEATTDQATPINLTQHSFFNLAGEKRK